MKCSVCHRFNRNYLLHSTGSYPPMVPICEVCDDDYHERLNELLAEYEDAHSGPFVKESIWDLPSFEKERAEINAIKKFNESLKSDDKIKG